MKIYFNGWFSGFMDKTNPGLHVDFFLDLFEKVYNEVCEIGGIQNSDILCEFDTLLNCNGTLTKYKKWKCKYLFSGESTMLCDPTAYDVVLCGERNHKNIVNIPLFIPYLYTNNFINKLTAPKYIINVPKLDVCVIISNPTSEIRNYFLNELDKHFNVTYAGLYKNNIGTCISSKYNSEEFINFVSQFKYIVSMENSRNDTYITEKIIHGLLANTIPIYWGSTRVFDYFNKNRFLYLDEINNIDFVINKMNELAQNTNEWTKTVSQPNFTSGGLNRNINAIVDDIICVLSKECWSNISRVYCINNYLFEPYRNDMLRSMFNDLKIEKKFVKYISPTYKTTITNKIYDKYTKNQLVRHLRYDNLKYGELSLFFNYRAVLEDIEKNYKDGLFLIFESDVTVSKDITKFNDFLNFISKKEFDLIHLGHFDAGIFSNLMADFPTGYRLEPEKINEDVLAYHSKNTLNKPYIEDITTELDPFRVIRKFNTRCTDSFLWKYSGIVKFLNFMRTFEDYSSPFDYYMCNYFENNLDFKHYWSVDEFFNQQSNSGLISSTLR